MDYPYPIRDWTRPDEYPKADALPLTGWAWEFLRRNPDYQRLWDLFGPAGWPSPCRGSSSRSTANARDPRPSFAFRTARPGLRPRPIPGEPSDLTRERVGVVLAFAESCDRFAIEPSPGPAAASCRSCVASRTCGARYSPWRARHRAPGSWPPAARSLVGRSFDALA